MNRCFFGKRLDIFGKRLNKNPPCYMCGGQTRRSPYAYISMQKNGPCEWYRERHRRRGEGVSITWERTRMSHVGHYQPFIRGSDIVLAHVTSGEVDTLINAYAVVHLDARHNIKIRDADEYNWERLTMDTPIGERIGP